MGEQLPSQHRNPGRITNVSGQQGELQKRLAWVALAMFHALNGRHLAVATDDAVAFMLAIASGEKNEGDIAAWLAERVQSSKGKSRRLQSRVAGPSGRAQDAFH